VTKKASSRSKTGEPAAADTKEVPVKVQVKVEIDFSAELGSHYVNHAEVGNTRHEFFILCGRLPAKLSPEQKRLAKEKGSFSIDPVVQLTVPPTLIPGLIQARMEQKIKYEKAFGKIETREKTVTQSGETKVH
jgi:hypothetical protein